MSWSEDERDDVPADREDPDPSDQDPDYDDGATDTIDCPYCGKAIYEASDFCHHCGKAISPDDVERHSPLFTIGLILCVILVIAGLLVYALFGR